MDFYSDLDYENESLLLLLKVNNIYTQSKNNNTLLCTFFVCVYAYIAYTYKTYIYT